MAGPSDDSLFDEAVNHAIRLQANPGSAAALEVLARWRARSPAHERAWAEIAEIHGMTGSLLARQPRQDGIGRRKVLGLAAAGLGLAGGAGLFGPGMILVARADHLTATGEIREIDLPDGSRVSLGPDSAIALEFDPDRRGIRLLAGMLCCAVVPASTVFRLTCGGTGILADTAELVLSEEAGALSLALKQGAARIATGPDAGTELAAGDWLDLGEGGRILRHIPLPAGDAAGWRDGTVVVEAEPLAVVVARIARWVPGRVVIADPGLSARLVSGVFDITRPREALLAAVSPHGAGLRQVSPWLTVITTL